MLFYVTHNRSNAKDVIRIKWSISTVDNVVIYSHEYVQS